MEIFRFRKSTLVALLLSLSAAADHGDAPAAAETKESPSAVMKCRVLKQNASYDKRVPEFWVSGQGKDATLTLETRGKDGAHYVPQTFSGTFEKNAKGEWQGRWDEGDTWVKLKPAGKKFRGTFTLEQDFEMPVECASVSPKS